MTAASNYLELKVLDHILRFGNGSVTVGSGAGYQPPATIHVGLFSGGTAAGTALESGTNSTSGSTNWGFYEINNGAYARQSITFAAAANGSCASNSTVTFPQADADYDSAGSQGNTITHIALLDASSSGNVLFYGALGTTKQVTNGDTFQINAGSLTISLA
jgi:hypothetical protein